MVPSLLVNEDLLALNMLVTNFNQDAPFPIPEWRTLVGLALRVFNHGGAGLLHDVVEIGVVKGAQFAMTTAMNGHPDRWFVAAGLDSKRDIKPLVVFLRSKNKIGQVGLCLL